MQMKPRLRSDFLAFAKRTFSEFIWPKNRRVWGQRRCAAPRGADQSPSTRGGAGNTRHCSHTPQKERSTWGNAGKPRCSGGMPTRDPFPAGQHRGRRRGGSGSALPAHPPRARKEWLGAARSLLSGWRPRRPSHPWGGVRIILLPLRASGPGKKNPSDHKRGGLVRQLPSCLPTELRPGGRSSSPAPTWIYRPWGGAELFCWRHRAPGPDAGRHVVETSR